MLERLAPLLIAFLSQDFGAKLARTKRNSCLYLIAGILGLTAYALSVVGLVLYLGNTYGPVAAMFAVAIGALALAIAVFAGILILQRNDRRKDRAAPAEATLLVLALTSLLPIVFRSRFLTSAVVLGAIALAFSLLCPESGDGTDQPPSA